MELEQLERLLSETDGKLDELKAQVVRHMDDFETSLQGGEGNETGTSRLLPTQALKIFFDRVAISSVPGIRNAEVVEVKSGDSMQHAITYLYEQNTLGAPVRDQDLPESAMLKNHYVGLVDFPSMVLWALEEFDTGGATRLLNHDVETIKVDSTSEGDVSENRVESNSEGSKDVQREKDIGSIGFFDPLNQLESAKVTKVGALARSFHWGPFLPIKAEDTLLDVLLLLSTHSLKAVPVIDSIDFKVRGFITKDVAVRLLLHCDGLAWFDDIAQKPLCDFRFPVEQNAPKVVHVFEDETVLVAMKRMWKNLISGMPVLERKTNSITGHIKLSDVRLLLDMPHLFRLRRTMSVLDFMEAEKDMKRESRISPEVSSFEEDFGAFLSATTLSFSSAPISNMSEPLTSRENDTLKDTMKKIVHSRNDRSFLVDDKDNVTGVITLTDIIRQFSPPIAQSPAQGDAFFQSIIQPTS